MEGIELIGDTGTEHYWRDQRDRLQTHATNMRRVLNATALNAIGQNTPEALAFHGESVAKYQENLTRADHWIGVCTAEIAKRQGG